MTPFERALRVREVWGWLPVFRVVAETQHLPTAGEVLHVSPSALSRTIRLLEEQLGQPLFSRSGRSIQLDEAGEVLLLRVRDAMRLIDEALEELAGSGQRRVVRISVATPLAAAGLLEALQALRLESPGLVAELLAERPDDINDALRRGTIDLALSQTPTAAPYVSVEQLAELQHRIWCGTRHPLARGRRSMQQVLKESFVAAAPDGTWHEPWPADLERHVALRVSSMQGAVDACRTGRLLAVLPQVVAVAGMRPVDAPFCELSRLYLIRRRPLPSGTRIDRVAETIKSWAADLS